MKIAVLILLLLFEKFSTTTCSIGDSSYRYRSCLNECVVQNCLEDGASFLSETSIKQDIWRSVLQWSCKDECCYDCMWQAVDKFKQMGMQIPKFHGKWPFVRLLGVQEPAAAFSSLLNLAANVHVYRQFRREFPIGSVMPIGGSTLILLWHSFAWVCMNGWVWSIVFHTRDKPFTEFLDYACALSMVMSLFIAAVVRVWWRRRRLTALVLTVPLAYFVTHVRYLYSGSVDYDYNMKLNVFFGVAGSLVWLAWASHQWLRGRSHACYMLAFVVLSGAALSLELLDFPPLWSAWDAHALWHLATAPLPLLIYKFVTEDLRLLQTGHYEKLDSKEP